MINFYSENIALPKIPKRKIAVWIKLVAQNYGKKIGEIACIFCDNAKILEINKKYLQHDYYTDIITFDYSEKEKISGDIFVSLDTVKSNSEKFNTLYISELHRVIIHGILHLCGQSDKTADEAKIMHKKENEAILVLEKMPQFRSISVRSG
jgi:rRNA maturation RNase YbeY